MERWNLGDLQAMELTRVSKSQESSAGRMVIPFASAMGQPGQPAAPLYKTCYPLFLMTHPQVSGCQTQLVDSSGISPKRLGNPY
jgi:hypothetical protein